jgi:hypothetical protein
MPIIDVEFVSAQDARASGPSAGQLASAIGGALGTPPGRTWVRLRALDAGWYAENDSKLLPAELPVFVTVLHAHLPDRQALGLQARLLTQVVATCFGCPADRVHVQYAPPGAGRQAFGGTLVE